MYEKSLENLQKKKGDLAMKVTTRISGYAKEGFINDCLNKECLETQAAKSIIEIYYQIVEKIPNHRYMEFIEIKRYINDNIKFK